MNFPYAITSPVVNVLNVVTSVNLTSFTTFTQFIDTLRTILLLNTNFVVNLNLPSLSSQPTTQPKASVSSTFTTDNLTINNSTESNTVLFSETSNSTRFTRFSNPLISYDYKCGHYLGI